MLLSAALVGCGIDAGGGDARSGGDASDASVGEASTTHDASPTNGDASPPSSSDAGPIADAGDGGSAFVCHPSAAITIYPRVGLTADDSRPPQGPGLVLMGGGTDVDAAFVWMHDRIAGASSSRAGDLVVLRASGGNAYDSYVAGLAPFQSVETILIGDAATPNDLACAADIVSRAEVIFFAGGDQSKYVKWRASTLMAAVQNVYDRGGVVGGTSAGCAILGEYVYDSVSAGATNVATADAIADPYESAISFTRGMLTFPPLAGAITDPHFHPRDRMGRLAAFMARQHQDGVVTSSPPRVLGVGVDEKNALVIDKHGDARLLQQSPGTGAAFLVRGGKPDRCVSGQTLVYKKLVTTRIDSASQSFSFGSWCGAGTMYSIAVSGSASSPYSPTDPYGASSDGTTCP